jgi:AcrR family transcriptional regulator
MTMTPSQRRPRADGLRTRDHILVTAARLATVEGLDRLSIGGLADHLGISKSGVFAHFRSKEALQLATIETAWTIFIREVVEPAEAAPPGVGRVVALIDRFLDHLERRVFPGGCFFASTIAEMGMRRGPVPERLAEFDFFWMGLVRSNLDAARVAGEIPADTDIAQLGFEIESHVVHAHSRFSISGDPAVLANTARAVRDRLEAPPRTT